MRASSSATETPGLLEDTQFGDVAPEEERHRPVGHDTQLPGKQRQLVEVIGPRHPPAEEALEREAEHRRDALVATKSRDLAQTPVAIGLWFAGEVLRQASCLAQCMLARGRVTPAVQTTVLVSRCVPSDRRTACGSTCSRVVFTRMSTPRRARSAAA